MSLTTSRFIGVFLLLCIVGARAFVPKVSPPRRPSGQSVRLGSEDYTTRDDDNTHASSRRRGNEPDDSDGRTKNHSSSSLSRRAFASRALVAAAFASSPPFLLPQTAAAGIDVRSLKTTPIEGDASGAALRLAQLKQQTAREGGTVELDSGVTYRETGAGIANRVVRNGSNVGACIAVLTPGGLPIYSTREDNDANELSWQIGSGDFPKGAEEGMVGMMLGSSRRIEVPSRLVNLARIAGVLPEATTEVGKERYEAAFRSGDARLVFDVRVTGVNQGDGRI